MTSSQAKRAALVAVAARQGGYFTARQTLGPGYAYPRQHYHVQTGDWERVVRGVFRLHEYPLPEREDLIVLSLLSHDRASQPQVVFSHETALALHELSDPNSARIHLTAPPGFRHQLPDGIEMHRGLIPPEDWEEREGYRVTTPLRTLLDSPPARRAGRIWSPLCATRYVVDWYSDASRSRPICLPTRAPGWSRRHKPPSSTNKRRVDDWSLPDCARLPRRARRATQARRPRPTHGSHAPAPPGGV